MEAIMRPEKKTLFIEIAAYEQAYVDVIRRRLGIVLHHQIREMYKAVVTACEKFNCTPYEYLQKITACEETSPYLEHLILGITIGETYFFRDLNQIKIIKEIILPNLIQKKRNENNLFLRIWSAGCSSGEEIYTMLMLLYDLLPDIDAWSLNLLGTDINTRVLQKAMNGIYTEWSMRCIPNYYKDRYFTVKNNDYLLSNEIKSKARFIYLNLNENCYPSFYNGTNAQDFILCRNVLIYFNSNSIADIMNKFNASLIDGAYLLLGASDPFNAINMNPRFSYHQGFILKKEPLTIFKDQKISPHLSIPIETIPTKTTTTMKSAPVKSSPIESFQDQVLKLLNQFNWIEVINLIDTQDVSRMQSAFSLSAKATALANLGKLSDAIESCEKSLALDPTNKFTYLTYALVLSELNKMKEAEQALRKTLFLDPKFVVAHFQLGLLLLRNKKNEAGIKSLRNALFISCAEEPNKTVPAANGMTYSRLNDILKHEIELYSGKQLIW